MNCWNQIGIYGDASCVKLDEHEHCRDCPTYQAAAVQLLDTAPSAGQLADATAFFARKPVAAVSRSYAVVIFRCDSTWLALPCAVIQEVVAPRPIHSVPHRRNGAVLGLVNIRGELLVCVALRFVLHLAETSADNRELSSPTAARMLGTQQGGTRIVYPVDEVFSIERFEPQHYEAVPALVAKAAASLTKALLNWRGNPVSLLDEESLLIAVNRSLALATVI